MNKKSHRCFRFYRLRTSFFGFLLAASLLGLSNQSFAFAAEKSLVDFGVIGDGQADDTVAIQQAIDGGLGNIRFPKGVYRITKPLLIDLDKVGFTSVHGDGVATIRMEGAGPALRLVGSHTTGTAGSGFREGFWERERMPLIDGIGITATNDEADGIEVSGTMQLIISRTHIRHCRHGIRLIGNNRNVIISDCHIYNNRGIGIFYDDVDLHQSNVTANHISGNDGGGIVSRRGNVRNIHITGSDIEGNMAADKPATANVLIDNRESKWGTGEVAITGCTIQHNDDGPDSANIRIIGRTIDNARSKLVRQGNVTITGNILSDVLVNVHLRDCRGVTITGNTIWKGYKHNLLVENCSHVIASANNCDRNGVVYGYGDSLETRNSIVVTDSENVTLSGLHLSDVWGEPAAVTVKRCRRMIVRDCMIVDCDNVGLWLEEVRDSYVSGCIIRDDRREPKMAFPIKVIAGEGNVIDGNLTSSNRPDQLSESDP